MSKLRGSNAEKWTDEDISVFIEVLHEEARKYAFNDSTISGPRWKIITEEFWSKTGKKDSYDENHIKTKYRGLRKDLKYFKDLFQSCSGYGKKNKGVSISKFRLKGLSHCELLDEIFGKSIATGNHVVYSTTPLQPTTGEPTEVEEDVFACEDNPANTEYIYHPMSMNTGNDNRSGKRTMCDASVPIDGVTSAHRKKNRSISTEGIFEGTLEVIHKSPLKDMSISSSANESNSDVEDVILCVATAEHIEQHARI
ncbi:hypothetical protein HAX54_030387 [Datura stramonium]|uniref:Myb/SANT-like domain-containing protein n=1 Tax=Datura stramonium TaxID=4076 RepID=A0ABS8V7L5_DATST|nr:hypothetical protein [Datura stramonium]